MAGGVEFPISLKGIDELLTPLVGHACTIAGLK